MMIIAQASSYIPQANSTPSHFHQPAHPPEPLNLISRQRRSTMASPPMLPPLTKEVSQLPLFYAASRRTSLPQKYPKRLVSDTIQSVARKRDGKLLGLGSPHCLRLQAKVLQGEGMNSGTPARTHRRANSSIATCLRHQPHAPFPVSQFENSNL